MVEGSAIAPREPGELERHRRELTAHCYRMLGSPFEAEDAVQEALLRAWRGLDRFQRRASLRSWLYTIATNVCLDMLDSSRRRARPMDLGPAGEPVVENLRQQPEATWIEPLPGLGSGADLDPAEVVDRRETLRLAFIAALQHLPPRQRAALLLCEVLHWRAAEAAGLLGMSVPAVNSALQRARAALAERDLLPSGTSGTSGGAEEAGLAAEDRRLLARYVDAFQAYDMDALTHLIREDAIQSMPPYDLWLQGREDVLAWWVGPGNACRGSRLLPAGTANGSPAYGQYKPDPERGGYAPWALQVVEIAGDQVAEITFFLSTERLFPLWGLPPRLD